MKAPNSKQGFGLNTIYTVFAIVVALGVGTTVTLFREIRRAEEVRLGLQFEKDVGTSMEIGKERMKDCFSSISAFGVYLDGVDRVDWPSFRKGAVPLLADRSDLGVLQWVPKVNKLQRAAFEKAARNEGMEQYRIVDVDATRRFTVAAERETYFPVLYVEPVQGSDRIAGLDLSVDPVSKEALALARDTGRLAVSRNLLIFQDMQRRVGFLAVFPSYQKEKPLGTVDERRAAIRGYLVASVWAGNYFKSLLSSVDERGGVVSLWDVSNPDRGHLALQTQPSRKSYLTWKSFFFPHVLRIEQRFTAGGRQWLVEAQAGPEYVASRFPVAYWLLLPVGIVLSCLCGYLLRTIMFRHSNLKVLADRRAVELIESKDRFHMILNADHDVILVLDQKTGAILDANQYACRLLDWPPAEIGQLDLKNKGLDIQTRIQEMEQEAALKRTASAPHVFEWTVVDHHGQSVSLEVVLRAAFIEGFHCILLTGHDITKRKAAEKAVRQNEERFRSFIESVPYGIGFLQDGKISYANPACLDMFGHEDTAEFLGIKLEERLGINHRQEFADRVAKRESLDSSEFECSGIRKDGSLIPMSAFVANMQFSDGVVTLVFFRDISEVKRAGEALRKNEANHRMVLEQLAEGFALLDEKGNVVHWNHAMEEISGLLRIDVMGVPLWEVQQRMGQAEGDGLWNAEKNKQYLEDALATGQSPVFDRPLERVIIRPGGDRRFVQEILFRVALEDGHRLGCVMQDITERKWIEMALQESDARYRAFVVSSLEGIGRWEVEPPMSLSLSPFEQMNYLMAHSSVVECNDVFADHYGFARSLDVLGVYLGKVIPSTDPVNVEFYQRMMRSEYHISGIESHVVARDGAPRLILHSIAGIIEDDHLVRIWSVERDITRKRQLEMALAESEEKFRLGFESARDPIILLDAAGIVMDCNAATVTILGATAKAQLLHRDLSGFYPERQLDGMPSARKARQMIEGALDLGQLQFDWIWRRASGGDFIVDISMSLIAKGETKLLLCHWRDISRRKQIESMLKAIREFNNSLLENMEDGVVMCDAMGRLRLFNKAARRWHGLELVRIPVAEWPAYYHVSTPETTTPMPPGINPLERAFAGENVQGVKMMIRVNGQPDRLLDCTAWPFFDEGGKKLGAVAVLRDVTEITQLNEMMSHVRDNRGS